MSFLSKIIEYAALEQLQLHLSRFDCLPKFQSAYREFHSVETAICRVYKDLLINKSKNSCSLILLLDLSAAFDTVDHHLLLSDLEHLGICGSVLKWFESYLTGRHFRVIIDDIETELGKVNSSVPQESILGPYLFLIYTMELSYILEDFKVKYHLYADDTQIYITVTDIEETKVMLDNIIVRIETWMKTRKLKLNIEKTECMFVGSIGNLKNFQALNSFKIGEFEVQVNKTVKNLSVILDSNLSLKEQIKMIKIRAINNLRNISSISKFLDRDTLLKLVYNLVLSSIDFCSAILYDAPNNELRQLQMIINNAARLVMKLPRFSRQRITPICIELHFLPVKARIFYKIALITYKALHFDQPRYLRDLLNIYNPDCNVTLRHAIEPFRLSEPELSRVGFTNRAFSYAAPRIFNQIPPKLRSLSSINQFKSQLKIWIFTQCYDLVNMEIKPSFQT